MSVNKEDQHMIWIGLVGLILIVVYGWAEIASQHTTYIKEVKNAGNN